jgi:hypothetical protein
MVEQNMHPQPLAHVPDMGLFVERPMINHQSYGKAVNNSAMIHMCDATDMVTGVHLHSLLLFPVIFKLQLHYILLKR